MKSRRDTFFFDLIQKNFPIDDNDIGEESLTNGAFMLALIIATAVVAVAALIVRALAG